MKFSGTSSFWCALSLLLTAGTAILAPASALSPANLRCEYAVNPLGVDAPNPRLFWTVESSQRGQKQMAYEILAASSPELLAKDNGDLWGSGKVASDETVQIPYAGRRWNHRSRSSGKSAFGMRAEKVPPGAGRQRGRWAF